MEEKDRIKLIRENTGLSQEKFAKAIGFTQAKVKDLETGKNRISPEFAAKVSEVYGINPMWLLYEQGPMENMDLKTLELRDIKSRYDLTDEQVSFLVKLIENKALFQIFIDFSRLLKSSNL